MIVYIAPELCQKGDFFLKKRMNGIFVLEFMFTLDKIQNISVLMCQKFEIFSYCMHSSVYQVSWPSDQVVDCSILILFRHSICSLFLFLKERT